MNLAENHRQTVLQYAPDSPQAEVYRKLAETILSDKEGTIPKPMSFDEMEEMVARYGSED